MSETATLVAQTRVRDGEGQAFGQWQARISAAVAAWPGFIEQSVMPPNPPTQTDWVILQRFASAEAATGWLRSDRRQALLTEVQPLVVGVDDIHLLRDSGAGVMPAPVSAVIATRIKPGQEPAYRAWERRIAAAQARAPGFEGYRFEPPVPGVQDGWLAILRFDSEPNMQAWLDSPERAALLRESEPFVADYHTRVVRSGFEQWFGNGAGGKAGPAVWKQSMVVVLMLYPVVFLFGRYVQSPVLMNWGGLPFWAALFVGNIASVILLNWLVPWAGRMLDWWLNARALHRMRVDLAGAALVVGLYAVILFAFSRMS
jgi:uncharacterized protein